MSRGFSWQLSGVKPFRDILRRAGVNSGALAATGLYQEGLKMMNVSQRRVPVRWGILRSTGHVYPPQQRGRAIEVVLAYGGPAAPYAWKQHEDLRLRHDSPTTAKYLENPVLEAARTFEGSLARRMAYLFESSSVLGSAWPAEHWHGPAPSSRPRRTGQGPARSRGRRSPRRPSR